MAEISAPVSNRISVLIAASRSLSSAKLPEFLMKTAMSGVRLRIAARARSVEDHAVKQLAVNSIEGGAKSDENGVQIAFRGHDGAPVPSIPIPNLLKSLRGANGAGARVPG